MARSVISLSGLLQAAAALAGGVTLAAFVGGLWWGLEITTHFRLQYGMSWWLARRRRNYPSAQANGLGTPSPMNHEPCKGDTLRQRARAIVSITGSRTLVLNARRTKMRERDCDLASFALHRAQTKSQGPDSQAVGLG